MSRHTAFQKSAHTSRLDGQYGTGAVLSALAGFSYVTRGKDYRLLDRPEIQARLHLPADQHLTQPERGICRALYDCPDQSLGKAGPRVRIIGATHPASEKKSRVGLTRSGVIYELFLTALPQSAFTAADVVSLYLHRGAFENALADEDVEQDPDRWCSHSAWGKAGMAHPQPMGVEPAPGTGPSAAARAAASHRVCPSTPLRTRSAGPLICTDTRVWTSCRSPALESWTLLWA
jgi:hypothetical protein